MESNNTNEKEKITRELTDVDQKAMELEKDFSYEGYHVVRKEFFSHLRDPAIIIRPDSVSFNASCINGLVDTVYINMMINPNKNHMVIIRSSEDKKDALRWCLVKNDARKSRRITSPIFSGMIYDQMHWDRKYRYKVLGYKINYKGEELFIFDLNDHEVFLEGVRKRAVQAVEEGKEVTEIKLVENKTKPKGYLPDEWKNSFGLPPEEHSKALEINDIDDYFSPEELR